MLTPDDWHILDSGSHAPVEAAVHTIDWDASDADKGVFEHYMLKEIYEQPEALENALRGRLDDADATAHFGGLNLDPQQLRRAERIILTACGTSYHAALVGEYLFEEFARMPVEVEYASEFRYRNPPLDRNTIVIAITQSGETADTLAALRESKRKGIRRWRSAMSSAAASPARPTAASTCTPARRSASPAPRRSPTRLPCWPCSPSISAGCGTSPVCKGADDPRIAGHARRRSPRLVLPRRACAALPASIRHVANFLYLGRQYLFPVALEGALKLKEISYIHAEGYPAAEMKHGPIALVDEDTPSVFLLPRGAIFDKVMSNLEEVKARGGPVIAVAHEGDEEVAARADEVICVPDVPDYLQPLVSVVPLQLLAYHIALLRGCDVDKPRNLAKSVTVE